MQRVKSLEGDVLVIAATAMIASYPLFLRLFPTIPTLSFLMAFQVVGAITFFLSALSQGFPRLARRDILLLIALAIVAIGHDLALFMAYRLTTVANTAIAHQSISIFLLFLAPFFLKERIHRDEYIALAFAFAGIVVLYCRGVGMDGMSDFAGISLAILSGLFFAFLFILYRVIPNEGRGLTISVVNFWRYIISTAMLLPFVFSTSSAHVGRADIVPLICFALFFAVIASGIHHVGLHKSRPLHASILGKTEPVFAIVFALLFLHEAPAICAIAGGILITGSGVWLALRTRGKL